MSLEAASGTLALLAGTVALAGLVVLTSALVIGWPGGIAPAIALLGLGYLGGVIVGDSIAPATLVAMSVALLLVGELGQWSLDRRLRGAYELGLEVSRGAAIALLVSLGATVAVLLLAVTGLPIPGGMPTEAGAVAAMVALLALVASVARRKRREEERIGTA